MVKERVALFGSPAALGHLPRNLRSNRMNDGFISLIMLALRLERLTGPIVF